MTTALLPIGRETVGSLLLARAAATPHAPFLLFDGGESTVELDYAATANLARRGAAVLVSAGVGRGDRAAVVLENRLEFFALWFGAALLGAVVVPTNPQGTVDELRHVFAHARCEAVICEPERSTAVAEAAGPGTVVVPLGADFDERAESAVGRVSVASSIDPRDPLAVLYTSGTTSRPKGVVVTHANYLTAGEVVAQNLRIRSDDRWLVVLPLFHANAQYYCAMSALVTGASLAVAHRFSASLWASQARRHHATLASLFAAPIRMILAQPEAPDDADNQLRAALFAQNLTAAQLARFEERFDCPLIQLYGMTETIAPPLMNPLFGRRDNMTIGRPTTAARVRVVNDVGADCGPGGTGELWVWGEPGVSLMAEYLDDPVATEAAMGGSWLRTGDVVRVSADGLFAFHDRAKDMIKRSGENVAAAEVERVVNEHPAVFESAVVGVPDPVRDEAIKVFAVLRDGVKVSEGDLIGFCAERLARFKVPSEVAFVDQLPRTSVGKVQRHLLRAREVA